MRTSLKIVPMAALGVMLLAALAFAQPGQGGPGRGYGFWSQIPAEKQEAVQKIFNDSQKKMFELRQQQYAKQAELDAVLANPKGDQSKVPALTKEISDLNAKILEEHVALKQKIAKETGIAMPFGRGGGYGGGCGYGGGGGCGYGGGYGGGPARGGAAGCCN